MKIRPLLEDNNKPAALELQQMLVEQDLVHDLKFKITVGGADSDDDVYMTITNKWVFTKLIVDSEGYHVLPGIDGGENGVEWDIGENAQEAYDVLIKDGHILDHVTKLIGNGSDSDYDNCDVYSNSSNNNIYIHGYVGNNKLDYDGEALGFNLRWDKEHQAFKGTMGHHVTDGYLTSIDELIDWLDKTQQNYGTQAEYDAENPNK